MDKTSRVQFLNEAVFILFDANAFGKGMNLYFYTAMGTLLDRLSTLELFRQPVKVKENSEFKPALLHVKVDLASHPAYGGGVCVNTYFSVYTTINMIT